MAAAHWSLEELPDKVPFMNCAAVAILFAVAQASSPSSSKTANRPAHAAHDFKDHAISNKAPSAQSPPPVESDHPQSQDEHGNGKGADSTKRSVSISELPPVTVAGPKRDFADWATWAFNFLLAITSGFQVWLLLRTLTFIRRQAPRDETAERFYASPVESHAGAGS